MSQRISIHLAPAAFRDLARLEDFLIEQGDPLNGRLLDFILDACAVLERQPGIGRPVSGGLRELIVSRGRGGYLARYKFQRTPGVVTVLRVRHQRESGYTAEEV